MASRASRSPRQNYYPRVRSTICRGTTRSVQKNPWDGIAATLTMSSTKSTKRNVSFSPIRKRYEKSIFFLRGVTCESRSVLRKETVNLFATNNVCTNVFHVVHCACLFHVFQLRCISDHSKVKGLIVKIYQTFHISIRNLAEIRIFFLFEIMNKARKM